MHREIIHTGDGSTTIRIVAWDECYHSKNGAIQEAYHVFINNGLSTFGARPISILEIGFGTGLNAFITFLEAKKNNQQISYTGVEAFPISGEELMGMNYPCQLNAADQEPIYKQMHSCEWETAIDISDQFSLTKKKLCFTEITDTAKFDLIYFDAFGFQVQPELWSADIFKIMFNALKQEGLLVTYAARGIIKRNMQQAGFKVEKRDGPPGKREMMTAAKIYLQKM